MPAKSEAPKPEKLFQPGERVFIEHPEESWVPGSVAAVDDIPAAHTSNSNSSGAKTNHHKYRCSVFADAALQIAGAADLVVPESHVHSTVPDESELGAVDDLLHLTYLHESTLLHSVRQRSARPRPWSSSTRSMVRISWRSTSP